MSDIDRMSKGIPLLQTWATNYHAQLGLQDKGRSIKWLVVCYSVVRIYEWDGSLDLRKVRGSGPLLWSGRLSRSSTVTPHRNLILLL